MRTFFTGDTHFNHNNIIKLANRPFTTIEEMNEVIIANWNMAVRDEDVVYHLGDFCFGKPLELIERLNGYIKIVPGNHDKEIQKTGVELMMHRKFIFEKILEIEVEVNGAKQLIVLCHYAMRSWNKSHYGSWHLYGHHHGNLPPHGLSFDVGVDTNNFHPYSLEDIADKMKTLSREFVIREA